MLCRIQDGTHKKNNDNDQNQSFWFSCIFICNEVAAGLFACLHLMAHLILSVFELFTFFFKSLALTYYFRSDFITNLITRANTIYLFSIFCFLFSTRFDVPRPYCSRVDLRIGGQVFVLQKDDFQVLHTPFLKVLSPEMLMDRSAIETNRCRIQTL